MGLTLRVHVPPLRQGLVAQGCSTISHCSPERPSAHVQRYLSGAVFSQVPPCLQGSWVPQKFKSVRGRVEWRNYEICGYIRGSGIDIIDDTPVPTPRSPLSTGNCRGNSPWSHNMPPQLVSQTHFQALPLQEPCLQPG